MKLRDEIRSIDGKVFDPRSGELLRQEEIETVVPSQAPKAAEPVDVEGIITQLSWGLNSAIFDLPDAVTKGIGKVLGIDDPVVLGDFMEYFNTATGETAPKNMRILAYGKLGFESEPGIGTVLWDADLNQWLCDPNEATEYSPEPCEITHWQFLPEPPK